MTTRQRISDLLTSCFGSDVVCVVASDEMYDGTLIGTEADVVGRMVEKRRREFTAGRVAARTALQGLGLAESPVPVGSSREPIWPAGVVGTISHCQELCVAAVATRESSSGLGLDLEPATPLEPDLFRVIGSDDELAALDFLQSGADRVLAKALFCIKESIYKAWYPVTGEPLGFLDVTVALDTERKSWRAMIDRPNASGFPTDVRGWYRTQDDFLLAGLRLPPGPPATDSRSGGGPA